MTIRAALLPAAILMGVVCVDTRPSVSFRKAVDTTLANRAVASGATGDLNHDGIADVVVSTPADGTLRVALGRQDGTFGAPANYSVSPGRGDLALGDFNIDGRLDVVIAASGIAVLLGNGDGSLQPPVFTAGSARDVVVADFDLDGKPDIASIGRNSSSVVPDTIDVYQGLGDGSFGGFHTVLVTDNSPRALAAGDLNGDGLLDLVIPVSGIRQLVVYVNQGAFAFARAAQNVTEVGPASTRTGDIDGNGAIDVVTANFVGSVSVFFGNGDGTLQPAQTYPTSNRCSGGCPSNRSLTVSDLNGDGRLDLVAATETPGTAAIFLNDGAGRLALSDPLNVLSHATFVSAADMDLDGATDLAVVSSAAGALDDGPRIVSTFQNKLKTGATVSRAKAR